MPQAFVGWTFSSKALESNEVTIPAGVGERENLGIEGAALGEACTTSCAGENIACCGGKCRLIASSTSTSPRLASMNGSTLEYACYRNQPSGEIQNPIARNVLPDFSYAGYKQGGVALPAVGKCRETPIQATQDPEIDTANIQRALDGEGDFEGCATPYAVELEGDVFIINDMLEWNQRLL
jgi:hypothetical protein